MSDEPTEALRVTTHARRRIKQRAKLPQRAAQRAAQLAFTEGMKEDDPRLSPPLRAKIARSRANTVKEKGVDGIYRVYRGVLYIFGATGALVTVLPGFDDPDQKGEKWNTGGKRWKQGRWQAYQNGKRPRRDTPTKGGDE